MGKTFLVVDNNFARLNVHKGDTIILDTENTPKAGDLTILTYKGQEQLVWYLGQDLMGYNLIAQECSRNTRAIPTSPNKVQLTGRWEDTIKYVAINE